MNYFALNVEEEKCWGCKACEVACKQENCAPDGVRLISISEEGPFLVDGRWHFFFRANRCRHCQNPECLPACPADAISRRTDSVVVLDRDSCSGCRACISACPYDAITFDEATGVAAKCNLCHHRLDNGLLPACADNVCLGHCIELVEQERE